MFSVSADNKVWMVSQSQNVSHSAIFFFNRCKRALFSLRKIKVRSLFVFHLLWSRESSICICAGESGDGRWCQDSCLFAFFHPLHISQKSAWQFSATAFPHRTLHQIKCHHGFVFSLPIGRLSATVHLTFDSTASESFRLWRLRTDFF